MKMATRNLEFASLLGGYDPTTPAPPKKAPARAPQTNRAAAGPSSKPANVQSTKASPSKTGKTSAPEDAIILYSDEEDDPPPPKNKGKAAAADPPPVPANGKTTVKRKAKGKGDSVQKDDEDAMEVDDVQTVEPQPAKADARPKPRPIARPQNKTQTRPHHDNSQNEALERENARLRKQLEEVHPLVIQTASRTYGDCNRSPHIETNWRSRCKKPCKYGKQNQSKSCRSA